ncbi:hypothetical protein ACFL3T_00725 [Patescibacteria group bacterium]
MELYTPAIEEIEGLNWNDFLKKTSEKPWVITLKQWRELLAWNITGIADWLIRVDKLFKTKPVIGLTPEGNIAIWTHGTFDINKIDISWTLITGWNIGTITNTDVKVVAVEINKISVTDDEKPILKEFIELTTDDLTNVPVIEYSHEDAEITKGGYTLCDGKINITPVPNGGKWITGFRFSQGQGTNAVIAKDDLGLEHSGNWDIAKGTVIYDAITAVEPTNDTTPRTSI